MTEELARYGSKLMEGMIHTIRNQKVIFDHDLAVLYGVPTKRLNEQVRRNQTRFPTDFAFQLSLDEYGSLRSQIATLKSGRGKHPKYIPWAFTEHGALMAATVLNSPQAVEMSLFLVRAFVKMRERLAMTHALEKHLAEIDRKLLSHDASLRDIYERIRPLLLPPPAPPKRKIGFQAEERRVKYTRTKSA